MHESRVYWGISRKDCPEGHWEIKSWLRVLHDQWVRLALKGEQSNGGEENQRWRVENL